jgi:tight adherence protein C
MPELQGFIDQLSGSGQYLPATVMGLIFASVALGVLATAGLVSNRGSLRRRLHSDAAAPSARHELSLRAGEGRSWLERLLKPLAQHLTPSDDVRINSMRMRLVQAGFMQRSAVGTYYAVRMLSAVLLPLAILAFLPILSKSMSVNQLLAFGASAILVGLYLPPALLSKRVEARQLEIYEGFPDALDMMLVCVEAGLGLDAAINRVGHEIGKAHPVLGEQMELVGLEMRAGKPRHEALRNLADRTGVDEVRSLVTLLIQSDALGSSIAQSLRVHAEDMRARRMLKAEEKAHKLPVKLSIPLILCVLPSLMIVILSPAALRIIDTLLPNLDSLN